MHAGELSEYLYLYIYTSESCCDDSDQTVFIFRFSAREGDPSHGRKGFREIFTLVPAILCRWFQGRRRPQREEWLAEEPVGSDRAGHGFCWHVQGVSCSYGTKGNFGNSSHLVVSGFVYLTLLPHDKVHCCLDCPDRSTEGVHALPWLRKEGREASLQAAR